MTTPTVKMPPQVNLRGIMHNVAEHGGLIVFTPQSYAWGCKSSITFERIGQCWYVAIESYRRDGMIMVSHILRAWEVVKEVYGGNFEFKEPNP